MNSSMSDRKYLVYAIVFVLLLIVLTMAGTYAYFRVQMESEFSTSVDAEFDCMSITYSESNIINLNYQYPISDEYAIENLTPVTISVTNNCTNNLESINYLISLTSLAENSGYISDDKIRVMVKRTLPNENEEIIKLPTYLNSLTKFNSGLIYNFMTNNLSNRQDTQSFTNKNIYRIDYSSLGNGEQAVYKVYVWLDYYEGDTTHTGANDNSTEGLDFKAATSAVLNVYVDNPDYNITLNNIDFNVNKIKAKENEQITITPVVANNNYEISSFKLNGELIQGNSFPMPNNDVTITDINYDQVIFNITNTNSNVTTLSSARYGTTVSLTGASSSTDATTRTYIVRSFKLNGELIQGDSFTMPKGDAVITDIINDVYVETSTHNPFPAVYYAGLVACVNTFEGATSISVNLTYQTYSASTSYSYVRLYKTNSSTIFGTYASGTMTTVNVTIPGNYIMVYWRNTYTSYSYVNRYGFSALIQPNYD